MQLHCERKMYMGLRNIYPGWINMIINQIYQLVDGFPAEFCIYHILVKTYSFT